MDTTPGPSGGPHGPFEPARAFATGYKPNSGDMMVYGGGVVTLIGVLATVVNGTPVALLASLAGSFSAFYFWPTLDTQRAQLAASHKGIFVARVGIIPWSAITEMRVQRRALRTLRLATLFITTDGPPRQVVSATDPVPWSERLTATNARISGNTVRVELHTLAMAPDAIEARLRQLRAHRSS